MTMPERPKKPPLATIEADLFGVIFGFHTRVMTLLRESSLDDEKLNVVAVRIKTLLDAVTAEVTLSPQANIKQRMESAYEEVERLVNHLSQGGKKG